MIPIQYQSSPILTRLVECIQQHYDMAGVLDSFYRQVMDIDTANSFGLDIWGRIVGIDRFLTVTPDYARFGFNTPNKSFMPFNRAPFRNGPVASSTYRLDDDAYRKLIMTKAMSNIVRPNAPTLNAMLQYLFDGRRCYALDLGGMRMRFVFGFYLEPYERAIVESEVFATPAGVLIDIVEIPQPNIFGFNEACPGFAPFGQGTLYNDGEPT